MAANFLGFLQGILLELVLTVEGVLVADMAFNHYKKRSERLKISIESTMKGSDLGFKVSTLNKTIKSAKVRCNNNSYDWDLGSKGSQREVDLLVGDEPSKFFPFKTSVRWLNMDEIRNLPFRTSFHPLESPTAETIAGGFLFNITEVNINKEVWRLILMVPEGMESFAMQNPLTSQMHLPVSIRIIGEGVEEVRDYSSPVVLGTITMIWPRPLQGDDPTVPVVGYAFRSEN